MTRTVLIRFEGQLIKTEMPIEPKFTGEITLKFYWKDGALRSTSVNKMSNAEVELDLSTLTSVEEVIE